MSYRGRSVTSSNPISLPVHLRDDETDKGPLISVLVATYEGKREHFHQLFKSLVNQPYTNLECVVVDSSRQPFLKSTAEGTEWITYVPSQPEGVAAGTNEAINHASGDVLALLDDDDYVTERRFVRTVEEIQEGADIVYGDVYNFNEEPRNYNYRKAMPLGDSSDLWIRFFRFDRRDGSVPAASVAFRADCVADERFNESLAGGEDYHLWVRLFKQYKPTYIPEPLAMMRQHKESLSSDPELMYENRVQAIDLLADHYPELRQYADERKRLEKYDYARSLMFKGRVRKARSLFVQLVQKGYSRAVVMALISLLPAGRERVVRQLDRFRAAVVDVGG